MVGTFLHLNNLKDKKEFTDCGLNKQIHTGCLN
jgi:hypothetical protein